MRRIHQKHFLIFSLFLIGMLLTGCAKRDLQEEVKETVVENTTINIDIAPKLMCRNNSEEYEDDPIIQWDLYGLDFHAYRFWEIEFQPNETQIVKDGEWTRYYTLTEIGTEEWNVYQDEYGEPRISFTSRNINLQLAQSNSNDYYIVYENYDCVGLAVLNNQEVTIYGIYTAISVSDIAQLTSYSEQYIVAGLKDHTLLDDEDFVSLLDRITECCNDWNFFQFDPHFYANQEHYLLPEDYVLTYLENAEKQARIEQEAYEKEMKENGTLLVIIDSQSIEKEEEYTEQELQAFTEEGYVIEDYGSAFNAENQLIYQYTKTQCSLEDGTVLLPDLESEEIAFVSLDGKHYEMFGMGFSTELDSMTLWVKEIE